MARFLPGLQDVWARNLLRAGLVPLLAGACMIDNPGFKLDAGTTGGLADTSSSTAAAATGPATGSTSTGTGGMTGSGSTSGGETDGSSTDGSSSTGAVCVPMTPCYTGRPDSQDIGPCRGGVSICMPGGEFEACEGEVRPQLDPCETPEDEDCNGSDSGCVACLPGTTKLCYSGPPQTEGLGVCVSGLATCTDKGAFGPCAGEVTPLPQEICGNGLDDDCNASKDDNC